MTSWRRGAVAMRLSKLRISSSMLIGALLFTLIIHGSIKTAFRLMRVTAKHTVRGTHALRQVVNNRRLAASAAAVPGVLAIPTGVVVMSDAQPSVLPATAASPPRAHEAFLLTGTTAGHPVYVVPALTTTAVGCSAPAPGAPEAKTVTATDDSPGVQLTDTLQVVPALKDAAAAEAVITGLANPALALYQRLNLRNMLMTIKAVATGNEFWAAFCTGFESGIDCHAGEEGQLDDLLTEPLHVGNVLDYGGDPNGHQMLEMRKYLSASSSIIGDNVIDTPTTFEAATNNTAYVWGAPNERLPFPDATFESMCWTWETYLSEAARVLKPDGNLLISWKPSWQSPRGHHIHPDMVEEWATDIFKCIPAPVFQPNGGTILDWSHLLLSEQKFFDMLSATSLGTCKGLARHTTDFVYKRHDLNRRTYEDVAGILAELPLTVKRVHAAEDFGVPPVTAEVWRKLKAVLPNSTHFRIGEAKLVLQKV